MCTDDRHTGTTDEFILVTNLVRGRQRTGHCFRGEEGGDRCEFELEGRAQNNGTVN